MEIISLLFSFRFSTRKSESQQKLAKQITHFTLQFCSKNLTHFTNRNSLDTICSRNTARNLSDFTNFPANMFLFVFGVRKNICSASFLDAQEPHSWSTLKAYVCIFLYISVRKLLFQRRSKILFAGGESWGWIISLRRIVVWASWNDLKFFFLIEIFGNWTIFQHFYNSIYSIKALKFSRQFGL